MIHIVGAGIAGIAAAIRLAAKGQNVQVWEGNAYPGGKLSEFSSHGYRFDAGPSLFTMPQYIEELFELAQRNIQNYFTYSQLDVCAHYFFADGTRLKAYTDLHKFAQEVEQNTQDSAQSLINYLQKSQRKYALTHRVFLEQSLHQPKNFLTLQTLKSIAQTYSLDIFQSLDAVNKAHFKDPRMVQFFNRYATYNGSDPYQTSGIMSMIPHFEFGFGTYFPQGGMFQITNSLFRLAQDMGVVFRFEHRVTEIVIQGKQVQGIKVLNLKSNETKELAADHVFSNMDVSATYKHLLPGQKAPTKILEQPKSSSGIIFYWGVKNSFPELHLHNLFFSDNYPAEFEAIFEHQDLPASPTIYLNISSKECPMDAPPNSENWFVMINTPPNSGQDWDALIQQARTFVLARLSKVLDRDIGSLIETEAVLDPRTIESRTQSAQGALYGNSSNNRYAAFLRHANFSKNIKNLYFCGGSVHPGGGIPLCLLSAKVATDIFFERQ